MSYEELIKTLGRALNRAYDALWVLNYKRCSDEVESVLNSDYVSSLLKDYKFESLAELFNKAKSLTKEIESIKSLKQSEYMLYTIIAPMLYRLQKLREECEAAEHLALTFKRYQDYIRVRLYDTILEAIMVTLELEESTTFELRALLLTHSIFIKEEKNIKDLEKTIERAIYSKMKCRATVTMDPPRAMRFLMWFPTRYVEMDIFEKRIYSLIRAYDIEFLKIRELLKSDLTTMIQILKKYGLLIEMKM